MTKRSRWQKVIRLFKEIFSRWSKDNVPRMAAALSYYTAFSLAPLLLLTIAIAGLVFGKEAVQGQIVRQTSDLIGQQSAEAIQSMIQAAHHIGQGILATVLGVLTLFVGARGVVSELRDSLDKVWEASDTSGVKGFMKRNLELFAMVLAVGFVLLVSLAISAALTAGGKILAAVLDIPEVIILTINFLTSWAIIGGLFATMFKVLPNANVKWKDVWVGGAVTSLLFSFGKTLLGFYIVKAAVGSSYGSAGSIMVILMWVYYSGLILYFGAEFTKVYAEQYGSRAVDL